MHPHVNICKNQLRLTLFYVFVHFVQIEISIIWWQALSSSAGLHFLQIDIPLERDRKSFHILDFLHFLGTHISHRGLEQAYSEKVSNWCSIFPVAFSSVPNIHHESYHIKLILNENLWICKEKNRPVWYQTFNVNTGICLNWKFVQQFFFSWLFLLIHWL